MEKKHGKIFHIGRDPYLEIKFPDGTPIVAYTDLQKETGLLLEISGRN